MTQPAQAQVQADATSDPRTPSIAPMRDADAATSYRATLDELFDDAWKHRRLDLLADAATRVLASTMAACGTQVAGHILLRLGHHVIDLAERGQAQRESDDARKEGRPPH